MVAAPIPLRDGDPALEAPGQEFSLFLYGCEFTRAGVAKRIGSAAITLMNLAYHADKKGHAWPSIPTLAAELGCTERQVKADIATLERVGALCVAKRNLTHGGCGNIYVLLPLSNLSRLAQTPARATTRRDTPGDRGEDIFTPDGERGEDIFTPHGEDIFTQSNQEEVTMGREVTIEGAANAALAPSPRDLIAREDAAPQVAFTPMQEWADQPTPDTNAEAAPPDTAHKQQRTPTATQKESRKQTPKADKDDPAAVQLRMDMKAAIARYIELTGEKGTRKVMAAQARECIKAWGIADTLATMEQMWADPFWRRGNLCFASVSKRVAAYKRGDLAATRQRRPAGQKGQRLHAMTYEEEQAAQAALPAQCRKCGCNVGEQHESWCKSGLGDQQVLVGQACVQ